MSDQKKSYYDALAVPRAANQKEVKTAFRVLALKYHPDRNPNNKAAETRFKEINEAYDVLSQKQKRADYDLIFSANFDAALPAHATEFNEGELDVSRTPDKNFNAPFRPRNIGAKRNTGSSAYDFEPQPQEKPKLFRATVAVQVVLVLFVIGYSIHDSSMHKSPAKSCPAPANVIDILKK